MVKTMNRRAALGAIAAAGAALAVPRVAQASTNDAELFAAVERFHALQRAANTASAHLSKEEARFAVGEGVAHAGGDEPTELQDAEAAFEGAVDELDAELEDLLEMRPVTVAGVRAMLAALLDHGALEGGDRGEDGARP
jgi:hypothetical protein